MRRASGSESPPEVNVRILIADDDPVSRRILERVLNEAGYETVAREDGSQAWQSLQQEDAPRLVVLDWMMPGMDGVEVCRKVRERRDSSYAYIVMLTSKGQKDDVVLGLDAGTDDYLTKPFNPPELVSRIRVGDRILHLESALAEKVDQLRAALAHVKQLQGLLPICMYCKKIRDDRATWHRLETYIEENSEAAFTHSLCEQCLAEHYPKQSRRK